MFIRAFAALLLMVLWPWRVDAGTPVPGDFVEYRVEPGDDLYTLAQRYFTHTEDYALVQRLNAVRDPRRLPIGKVIRVPRRLLRYELLPARIVAFRGTVRVTSPRGENTARIGATLREGDTLVTAANSFVTLRLPDESVISLPSQSRVEVRRLRKVLLTQGVERLFAVVSGRAKTVVTPFERSADEFRISTPAAVSAVRGTEFRVSYDVSAARATTEVLEGEVGVAAGEIAPRSAVAGFGIVSGRGGVSEALRLLSPPKLLRPGNVQDDTELVFEVEPVPGAATYHAQVAQDAGFLDVVAEAHSRQPRVALPAVDDGTWFVRLSAIDSNGLEGLAETYSFQRRLHRIETALDVRKVGGVREYLFRWRVEGEGVRQYRFQLQRAGEPASTLVDEPGLSGQRFVITDLPAGTYLWRVQTLQFVDGAVHQKWAPHQRLTIASDE